MEALSSVYIEMRQTWNHGSVGMGDEAIERGGRRHAGGETTSDNLKKTKYFNPWYFWVSGCFVNLLSKNSDLVVTKNFMFVMLEGTRN